MASATDEHINFYLNDLSVGYLTMYSIYEGFCLSNTLKCTNNAGIMLCLMHFI